MRVPELKTMFPVKSETSDTFDVGKDSHRIRLMDDNPHISNILNINTSENRHDKKLCEEMLLTVAYVKNENVSNSLDYNTSDSKGNEVIYGQNLTDINVIKTERTEAYTCNYNTSGDVNDDEHDTMHVKQELQHYHVEHNIHLVTDTSQHDRVDMSDTINMGDICPSSATQARHNTHKHIPKRVHLAEKRYKCDLCAHNAKTSWALLRHKRVHTSEKPFKCDILDYSATQYENQKTHELIDSGEKPYKCDLCDFSTTRSGVLKMHKLILSGEKTYKCNECDYSSTTSRNLEEACTDTYRGETLQV